jgi:hypothetical protein
MTPIKEGAITASILRWLRTLGWAVKLHGSAWQQAGLPDILAVIDGRTYFLEVAARRGGFPHSEDRPQADSGRRR